MNGFHSCPQMTKWSSLVSIFDLLLFSLILSFIRVFKCVIDGKSYSISLALLLFCLIYQFKYEVCCLHSGCTYQQPEFNFYLFFKSQRNLWGNICHTPGRILSFTKSMFPNSHVLTLYMLCKITPNMANVFPLQLLEYLSILSAHSLPPKAISRPGIFAQEIKLPHLGWIPWGDAEIEPWLLQMQFPVMHSWEAVDNVWIVGSMWETGIWCKVPAFSLTCSWLCRY